MVGKIIRIIIMTILKGIVKKYLQGNQDKREQFKEAEELEYEVLEEEKSKFSADHYQKKVQEIKQDIERGKFTD